MRPSAYGVAVGLRLPLGLFILDWAVSDDGGNDFENILGCVDHLTVQFDD